MLHLINGSAIGTLEHKRSYKVVEELFGVNYSDDQTRKILVDKLGINYAKPFVGDKRRPKDAEGILADRMGRQ